MPECRELSAHVAIENVRDAAAPVFVGESGHLGARENSLWRKRKPVEVTSAQTVGNVYEVNRIRVVAREGPLCADAVARIAPEQILR